METFHTTTYAIMVKRKFSRYRVYGAAMKFRNDFNTLLKGSHTTWSQ